MKEHRGMIFVLDGLLGGGKTTLGRLLTQTEKYIQFSVSATTRPIRPNEIDGVDYHFMTKEEFLEKEKQGYFLETSKTADNFYGTPKRELEEALKAGNDIIFDVGYTGTRALKEAFPDDVVTVYLMPPSYEELKSRLWERGTETEESFLQRMHQNADYLKVWEEYDYIFINGTVQDTLKKLQQILRAERLRRVRQPWIKPFVTKFKSSF
jgi:guanylate kinase